MTNYTTLLGKMGTDATKWAEEFCKRFPDNDEDTMLTWFSCAIETGRDAAGAADLDRGA